MSRSISSSELAAHKSASSCWVVIHGKVYDVTAFLPDHPGGKRSILTRAGKDATADFDAIHPPGTLEEVFKNGEGVVGVASESSDSSDSASVSASASASASASTYTETPADMINIADFEEHASRTLSKKAWAYYFSASDDLYSKNFNHDVFAKVMFRPRIFRDVTKVDTSSSIFGVSTSLPIFVSPAALARLAHPDGEKAIARACGKQGILQMISNNASLKYPDIVTARVSADQPFAFQLYVQNDRARSVQQLKDVVAAGCRAIVLTLDAPTPGKRELDERVGREEARASGIQDEDSSEPLSASSGLGGKQETGGGVGRALFQGTAGDLVWSDLLWLKAQLPDYMKIVLKGLQTVEDVVLAAQQRDPKTGKPLVDGVIISNHGGRAVDGAPAPLMVLEELRLYTPEVFTQLEIYLDGGIRRGTDVVKALCLGATQVGIGRPALFSLAGGFGENGVHRVIQILREEVETAMRLLGATSLDQLGPHYVNTAQLDSIIGPSPAAAAASAAAFTKSKL
ncbi:FMN-dependent dehydrogenase [Myxozyma melibiosi]|uniref:FMN-dependent dehydrogenase n=1 Tax=Myxozyma melibiosi TaxID=54550 RepID=A0ABR1EZS5_9ASCO